MGKHSNLKMLTRYIPIQMVFHDKKGFVYSFITTNLLTHNNACIVIT